CEILIGRLNKWFEIRAISRTWLTDLRRCNNRYVCFCEGGLGVVSWKNLNPKSSFYVWGTDDMCGWQIVISEWNDTLKRLLGQKPYFRANIHFVGVGMVITDHPLHRSGRALLTHPALVSGHND